MQSNQSGIGCGNGSDSGIETDGCRSIDSASTIGESVAEEVSVASIAPSVQQSVAISNRSRQRRNSASSRVSRARHFCFTWNNPPNDCGLQLKDLSPSYFVYQHEIGESGTKHLQGVISFTNPRAFPSLARRIRGWHIEIMRGTIEQAVTYCTKTETRDPDFGEPETFGTRPRNAGKGGGRSDIDAVAEAITEGASVDTIAEQYGGEFIKFHRGIERLIGLRMPTRNFKTEIRWYYGPTGTGKTRAACNEAVNPYWKNPAHKWWDGYEGQEDVIIDDVRCDFAKFSEWLRLFDRYPVQVEVKGCTRNFISKRIFVTAPLKPEDMWQSRTAEDLNQLMRRIEVVKFFGDHDFNPNNAEPMSENFII